MTVVLQEGLDGHAACRAWHVAGNDDLVPSSIEILKLEREKSAVYRLTFPGRGAPRVIAKRRPEGELADEVRLHGEFLPALGVSTLELYGVVEELDGFSWLFLEDAGETPYTPEVAEHQSLAIGRLARLHASASPGPSWLSDTGPAYFRSILDLARDGVHMGLAHAAVSASDRKVLSAILTSLETVEERWPRVERTCARMPRTLVHGDFVPKNVRVRKGRHGLELVAFDWETAGVAPPAVDLALLHRTEEDLRTYLSIVNEVWPDLRPPDVEQMMLVGDVFRVLHSIYWAGRSFKHDWVQHAMWDLVEYERDLRTALDDGRWIDG